MLENKVYICECGRTFTDPQGFNGHKGHCKIHLLAKDPEAYERYKKKTAA